MALIRLRHFADLAGPADDICCCRPGGHPGAGLQGIIASVGTKSLSSLLYSSLGTNSALPRPVIGQVNHRKQQ
jgi:hypothetical protein